MKIVVGDPLPLLETAPLTATVFAHYAAASGDHNPLHLDPATAHAAGQPDVIAHGMYVMGLLGRVATAFVGVHTLDELQTRFVAPTYPGETLHCGGVVTAVTGRQVVAELWARNTEGATKAQGTLVATMGDSA